MDPFLKNEHDDTPPPLPKSRGFTEDLDQAELLRDEINNVHGALSVDYINKLKARAHYHWLKPCDVISATQAWERVSLKNERDEEATYALVDLYGRLGRKKALIEKMGFVEHGAEEVLANRDALILGALTLETRFKEYTEAFKCWLALYEHSQGDRERCLTSFRRLSDHDRGGSYISFKSCSS